MCDIQEPQVTVTHLVPHILPSSVTFSTFSNLLSSKPNFFRICISQHFPLDQDH